MKSQDHYQETSEEPFNQSRTRLTLRPSTRAWRTTARTTLTVIETSSDSWTKCTGKKMSLRTFLRQSLIRGFFPICKWLLAPPKSANRPPNNSLPPNLLTLTPEASRLQSAHLARSWELVRKTQTCGSQAVRSLTKNQRRWVFTIRICLMQSSLKSLILVRIRAKTSNLRRELTWPALPTPEKLNHCKLSLLLEQLALPFKRAQKKPRLEWYRPSRMNTSTISKS